MYRNTHRVNIDWLYEVSLRDDIFIRYIDTQKQLAYILTKPFPKKKKSLWDSLLALCGLRPFAPSPPTPLGSSLGSILSIRPFFATDGQRLYFPVEDRESDIYVAEVAAR